MTFIGITAGDGDRPQLTLKSAQLSPRTLSTGPASARIALVSTTALLLGGDHVTITIDVGAGCRLEIVDTAGTVAYDSQGHKSSWTVDATVAEGGQLVWKAEPMIVADGADVTRSTTVRLAAGATACLRETVVLGRVGESGGAFRSTTDVTSDNTPLLIEDLDLSCRAGRERPGILGNRRVLDTVGLFGVRGAPVPSADVIYFELAGQGSVARFLGTELHRSGVPAVFAAWRSASRSTG